MTEWNTKGARAPKDQESFPDLWIVDEEHPKAIEVELKQKSELRYKEIFYRYSSMVGFDGEVLYLTGWPNGPDMLWRLAKKYEKIHIYVASLAEFRESQGRCDFIGYTESYYCPSHKTSLALAPQEAPEPDATIPAPVPSVQEAPDKASLDAPQEPAQWGGGPGTNPYKHLPPLQRPEGWR